MKSDRKEEFELREGNKKADNRNSETAQELGTCPDLSLVGLSEQIC